MILCTERGCPRHAGRARRPRGASLPRLSARFRWSLRRGGQGQTQNRGNWLYAHVVGNERRSRQGQRGAAAGGDRELRDQCDLPHAGASERRVGFTLSSPPCPGRQPQAPPGHLQAKQPAFRKSHRRARHAQGRAFQSLKNANPPNSEIPIWQASDAVAVAQP